MVLEFVSIGCGYDWFGCEKIPYALRALNKEVIKLIWENMMGFFVP